MSRLTPAATKSKIYWLSRHEALQLPRIVRLPCVAKAVVQPAGTALPELNPLRFQNIAAPVRRQRHVTGKFLRHFIPLCVERRAIGDHIALVRRPRRETAAARTGFEIRLRFLARNFSDRTGDANLPL